MAVSKEFLDELKRRNSLVDIAPAYVNLKRRGKNLLGLCPFHNEKTPSFNIYPDSDSFFCFGCEAGGDIITFIMRIENLDYMEALRFLAQRSGMPMPEEQVDNSMSRLRTRVLEINRETARFFFNCLSTPDGKPGLSYLKQRGLDSGIIRRFGLGFAPENGFTLVNHLKEKGFLPAEMVAADVARLSKNGNPYDRFRGRVMFPIIDLRGNVVAFGGRILTDEKPKYLNTMDTLVYHKSRELFALNVAKDSKSRQLILAEGYMDVIALHRAGFGNAVATLGTALTEEQARILRRYTEEVILCYDSDEAGQRATQRAIPILKKAGLFVRVVTVPGNKDPDEFMRAYGTDGPLRFKALLENSGSDVEYRLFKIRSQYDLEQPEGRVRYFEAAKGVLASVESAFERGVYAGKISQETEVKTETVLAEVEALVRQNQRKGKQKEIRSQQRVIGSESKVNGQKREKLRTSFAEENILAFLFDHPGYREELLKAIPPEKFVTAWNGRIYKALLGKTIDGAVSLSDFSGELTQEEMSELTRVVVQHRDAPPAYEDIQKSIGVILTDPQNAGEDMTVYLEQLKKQKMGE